MELIIIIILFFFGGAIFNAIGAAGKSVVTGKSFKESYTGIPDFGLRLKNIKFQISAVLRLLGLR